MVCRGGTQWYTTAVLSGDSGFGDTQWTELVGDGLQWQRQGLQQWNSAETRGGTRRWRGRLAESGEMGRLCTRRKNRSRRLGGGRLRRGARRREKRNRRLGFPL
ncbi:hypothetical protein PIB30_054542 [Stylosanthes scabra]|uniref:Uncharacterized protein n=1 Tax=Stylosanthes scabra TaxID=79078 RepID=A0ABU6ZHH7_9FABA|nr:hypothetical protein [Stylosanthes scabra]